MARRWKARITIDGVVRLGPGDGLRVSDDGEILMWGGRYSLRKPIRLQRGARIDTSRIELRVQP